MLRRFELEDKTATKFWEIEARDELSFTCRWGNVGATGKSERNYMYGDAAAATQVMEKLIAERMKAGFAMVGGRRAVAEIAAAVVDVEVDGDDGGDDDAVEAQRAAQPAKPAEPWNRKLDALLADNPDDIGTWQVYADWMLEHGQPWGEMIAAACTGKRPKQAQDEATKKMLRDIDGSSIEWRYGTIEKVSLCPEEDDEAPARVLKRILAHPAGRFVRELELGLPPDDDCDWSFESLLKVIKKAGVLPLLRVVDMTPQAEHMDQDSWRRIGDLRCLWTTAPNLRTLLLRGSEGSDGGIPIQMGDVVAPRLEKFVHISSGLDKRVPIALGKATLPELRHLELYFGDEDYGCTSTVRSIAGVLAGKGLPNLEYLGLENSMWEEELIEAVVASAVLPRLKVLDLSKGILWRKGPAALIANARAFAHLDKLDLSDNFIGPTQAAEIKQAIPCAYVDDQREIDDDDDDDPYRYVAIGE